MNTLQSVKIFKLIYGLETAYKNGTRQITHYATVLIPGRSPVWGVFAAQTGRLIQCFGSRAQIEDVYPRKHWVKLQMSFTNDFDPRVTDVQSYAEREAAVRRQIVGTRAPMARPVQSQTPADSHVRH